MFLPLHVLIGQRGAFLEETEGCLTPVARQPSVFCPQAPVHIT